MHRPTYLTVNTDAVLNNVSKLALKSGKEMIAVIKANAYGVGDIEAAHILKKAGIKFFAVSSLDEALHLRKHGINEELLILGYVDEKDLPIIKDNDLTILTVNKNSFEHTADLTGIKIHLKIDTGMRRIGLKPEEAKEVLSSLLLRHAEVNGIMTHYAKSDELDEFFTKIQYERFKNCVLSLNYPFKYIHASNTDASLNFDDDISTHARSGLGLWGYSSIDNYLLPSLSLKTRVINCKKALKDEAISYGGHYISDGEGYIITLPIGYADGLLRRYTDNDVYIAGERAKIVGSICMDQMMIHTIKPYQENEEVEIFGEHISLNEVAKASNTITYEILTSISDRVTRIYLENNQIYKEETPRFMN